MSFGFNANKHFIVVSSLEHARFIGASLKVCVGGADF
jgi:hypothetical protein